MHSKIFRDPENLPSISEVLREFQRIRKRGLRVSDNLIDTIVEARDENQDLLVRVSLIAKPISDCGETDDWCILCDSPQDKCTTCDALDCIGCDEDDGNVGKEDIVSNPVPLVHELTLRKATRMKK